MPKKQLRKTINGNRSAMSSSPDILTCNEPTADLDVTIQAKILELIKDAQDRLCLSSSTSPATWAWWPKAFFRFPFPARCDRIVCDIS